MPGGSGYAFPPGGSTVPVASESQWAASFVHAGSPAAARCRRRVSRELVSHMRAVEVAVGVGPHEAGAPAVVVEPEPDEPEEPDEPDEACAPGAPDETVDRGGAPDDEESLLPQPDRLERMATSKPMDDVRRQGMRLRECE